MEVGSENRAQEAGGRRAISQPTSISPIEVALKLMLIRRVMPFYWSKEFFIESFFGLNSDCNSPYIDKLDKLSSQSHVIVPGLDVFIYLFVLK